MRLITALRALRRDERGFTMVTVMTVMFCVTLLSIAALSAAQNDIAPGAHDKSRKIAYAAAEAGVQNYLFHLSQDLDYWAKCTTGAAPQAVNDPWNGSSPVDDPRAWMSVPGSTARYTIELLPAGGSVCSTADPEGTMIDIESGTFKIRATGEDREDGVKRSIIATFKRQSLLDYLYFTDKETRAPELYAMQIPSRTSRVTANPAQDLTGWATANCDRYWGNDPSLGNRGAQVFAGEYLKPDGTWQTLLPFGCLEPGFNSAEVIAGPMHTNDEFLIDCLPPPPQLGDSPDDAIETSSSGQSAASSVDPKSGLRMCAASEPIVNFSTTTPLVAAGTSKPRSAPLKLPLTNAALLSDTAPAYRFKGKTTITMSGTSMKVTGTRMDGTTLNGTSPVEIPADGVVYVANDVSCNGYTPVDSDGASPTCGNLHLKGDYARNVTFTAENDIVIMGNVTRTDPDSQFLLGLIASNYVRVHHPVTGCNPAAPVTCNSFQPNGCANAVGTPTNVSITGAILSLRRSFIVDNWFCGGELGTLTIYGAIAQGFHGPVYSITKSGVEVGYDKAYRYDSKLRYRSPPHFLDPVNAQWRVQTFSEQVPAR